MITSKLRARHYDDFKVFPDKFQQKCSYLWPCSQYAEFCFAKEYVHRQPFLVPTIFFNNQNFRYCHQTSNMPSKSLGSVQFFVRRQNRLFLDSYPSSGNQFKILYLTFLVIRKMSRVFRVHENKAFKSEKSVITKFSNSVANARLYFLRTANRP